MGDVGLNAEAQMPTVLTNGPGNTDGANDQGVLVLAFPGEERVDPSYHGVQSDSKGRENPGKSGLEVST